LFHAGFSWIQGGYVGVDIFFVISGYLITTIIISERISGTFSLLGFYERRARRILPALLVVMFASLVAGWTWMMPKQFKEFGESVFAVALFGSNVLFWLTSGYFDAAAEEKPLLHTWSLGVEEQYYMLFPLLVAFLWSWGRRKQMAIMLAIALASLGLAEFLKNRDAMANFFLAPSRAWELMIGSLLAYAAPTTSTGGRFSAAWAQGLSLLGLAMIITSVFAFGKTTAVPGLPALLPTLGTALILYFANSGTLVMRWLSTPVVVGVGLVSYSAYLWHQPLFAFARILSPDKPAPGVFGLLGLAALALAYLTWRFVETPFRNRRVIG